MSLGAAARFVASQSFIQQAYKAEDVLDVFSAYGFVSVVAEAPSLNFSELTIEACQKSLPGLARNKFIWNSWNIVKIKSRSSEYVHIPLDLVPHFIGKGGATIKSLEKDLISKARSVVPSSVQMQTRMVVAGSLEGEDSGRFHIRVVCEEIVVGVIPTVQPADAALRQIACHARASVRDLQARVRDLQAGQLRRSIPKRSLAQRKRQPGSQKPKRTKPQRGSCGEYYLRKEGREPMITKIKDWRSNKHYRRPPPRWCRYQWMGGRYKAGEHMIDDSE